MVKTKMDKSKMAKTKMAKTNNGNTQLNEAYFHCKYKVELITWFPWFQLLVSF